MRRPTPRDVQLEWWRNALAGKRPPIHEDEPHCGWYECRLVRGGPWVAVRIWLHQDIDPDTGELANDERLRAEVDGREADPYAIWTRCCARPVTEQAFNYKCDAAAWDRRHDPAAPAANPHRAIDHLKTPIPF